jgi:hypothetical protein
LERLAVIQEPFRSLKPTQPIAGQFDCDDHHARLKQGVNTYPASAFADVGRTPRAHVIRTLQVLMCAGFLVATGCQDAPDAMNDSPDAYAAAREEVLRRNPVPPPDTPEQTAEKIATVEASLPKVYELLEEAETYLEEGKWDTPKYNELCDFSMSLLTLVPGHREGKVAYCKCRLVSYFAKEMPDGDRRFNDEHHMGVDIRSAALEIDRLREFSDLSEEEVQLCQKVYFERARMNGISHDTEDFADTLQRLMSAGFRDAERLKAEPRFEYFFTDPATAPLLQAAIVQIEMSAEDVPETDTSEDESPPQPE